MLVPPPDKQHDPRRHREAHNNRDLGGHVAGRVLRAEGLWACTRHLISNDLLFFGAFFRASCGCFGQVLIRQSLVWSVGFTHR